MQRPSKEAALCPPKAAGGQAPTRLLRTLTRLSLLLEDATRSGQKGWCWGSVERI